MVKTKEKIKQIAVSQQALQFMDFGDILSLIKEFRGYRLLDVRSIKQKGSLDILYVFKVSK